MAEYIITIANRIASIPANVELVCNNPSDTIRFKFDDEWYGHTTKTARFAWDGKYIDVVFEGSEVQVPEITRTNYVYVGVFADEITSTPVKLPCHYSIKCLGGAPDPPAPDVYEQIIWLINNSSGGGDGGGTGGISPTISVTEITGGHRITIRDVNGEKSLDVMDGDEGTDGEDGVGITGISIKEV